MCNLILLQEIELRWGVEIIRTIWVEPWSDIRLVVKQIIKFVNNNIDENKQTIR